MDSLRRIEDDVRNLGIEAKKKYPAVKEATEKSFQTLKQMRDSYVAEVMRKDAYTGKFRSSDVTAPYYMICSQPEAPTKLLQMALGGIQLFLDLDCIPPSEAAQIMRIFNVQANAGKNDIQLKVLQMTLQFANLLYQDKVSSQYLTDSILRDMLLIPLQLCDGRSSVSVVHTASATANQIVGLIMHGVCETLQYYPSSTHLGHYEINSDQASSSLILSAQLMIKDLSLLAVGKHGVWMKGTTTAQTTALDLVSDILSGWKHLFRFVPMFVNAIKEFICPAIHILLKRLQNDFVLSIATTSINTSIPSSSITSRVLKTGRFILHNFTQQELLDEIELMVSLMAQSFHAVDLDETFAAEDRPNGIDKVLSRLNIPITTAQMLNKPQALIQQTLSNLNIPSNRTPVSSAEGAPNLSLLTLQRLSSGPLAVHAHPAGGCLEAILSFLLTDNLIDTFMLLEGGGTHLGNIFTVCLSSCASVISESMLSDINISIFEEAIKDTTLVSLVEGILTGDEVDAEHAIRRLHDHVMGAGAVSSPQVVLLCFQIIQVVSRLLTQGALKVQVHICSLSVGSTSSKCFLSPELLPPASSSQASHPFLCPIGTDEELRVALTHVCEMSAESAINACVTILLSGVENSGAIRRCLGVISELAFTSGILGLHRPCEVGLSTLCKFSVPQWGHSDKPMQSPLSPSAKAAEIANAAESNVLRWRHIQSFVRLVQVVHVLADTITDWDVIIDCFEQLCNHILAANKRVEITADELEKIVDCINRFKSYSIYMADETLVKLMASLVALSLNTLAVSSSVSGSKSNQGKSGNNPLMSSASLAAVMSMGVANNKTPQLQTPSYMAEGVSKGLVGFSMQAAIDISKINAFRVSSVWQMVMSHLRMVASLKSGTLRVVSVAATFDIIASTLEFLLNQSAVVTLDNEEFHPFMLSTARLTDDIIYNLVMPQFETCFDPLRFQRVALFNRLKDFSEWPKLTQIDLFSSMKSLSAVRYDDVRKGVLFGLRSLLQGKGGGQIKGVGWVTIIELLILVPSSMKGVSEDSPEGVVSDDEETIESTREQWPKATLDTAFACMTLIVDDFLEELPDFAILQGICCLAAFGSQIIDVNISLTAVELLWKVTDHALSCKSGDKAESPIDPQNNSISKIDLLNLTMTHLQTLSKDYRPEIRNCAMRTLFGAIVANSSLLSLESWKFVFDDILFPLFGATVEKSGKASNEQSDAPELKKGVKMTMHHSRDTASKQWAETISVEVKGFARIFKVCTKMLLEEDWFFATWSAAIDIFVNATRTPTLLDAADRSSEEVSLAGLDSLISLLKTASPSSLQTTSTKKTDSGHAVDHHSLLRSSKVKDMLWQSAWKAVCDLAVFDECFFDEFALKFLAMLSEYYNSEVATGVDSVFAAESSMNGTKTLLEAVVTLSRPRRRKKAMGKPAELQTLRSILTFCKAIIPISVASFVHLVSALAEITFSIAPCVVKCPFRKIDIVLEPIASTLRFDISKYLECVVNFEDSTVKNVQKCVLDKFSRDTRASDQMSGVDRIKLVCLDIVSRRFIIDTCEMAINHRVEQGIIVDSTKPPSPSAETRRKASLTKTGSKKFMGGFFSAVGNILLSNDEEDLLHSDLLDFVGNSLHRFSHNKPSVGSDTHDEWGVFHTSGQDIEALHSLTTLLLSFKSDVQQTPMKPLIWSSLMLSVMCVGSPWSLPEIEHDQQSVEISDEEVDKLCSHFRGIVCYIVSYALQERIPLNAISTLTETITAVARLQVKKLGKLIHPSHVRVQVSHLECFFDNLVLISQSIVIAASCRQKAFHGLVSLMHDAVDCLFIPQSPFVAERLRRCCERFIRQMLPLKCSLDVLPSDDTNGKRQVSPVAAWSECCHQVVSFAEEEWIGSLPTKSAQKHLPDFAFIPNNHVLLLVPLALRILKSECSEGVVDTSLRDTAATIISGVDMPALVTSLKKIDLRLSKLEADKEVLDEMHYLNAV